MIGEDPEGDPPDCAFNYASVIEVLWCSCSRSRPDLGMAASRILDSMRLQMQQAGLRRIIICCMCVPGCPTTCLRPACDICMCQFFLTFICPPQNLCGGTMLAKHSPCNDKIGSAQKMNDLVAGRPQSFKNKSSCRPPARMTLDRHWKL